MTTQLTGNAQGLASAIECDRHCEPASRIVRDGRHRGTLFTWVDGRRWVVYDLENRQCLGEHDRLAVVTIKQDDGVHGEDEAEADRGLGQCCLACDLEVLGGEWVVDAEELPDLRDVCGDTLTVLWEQE